MSGDRPDVIVVGAGPTGLAAACELARPGVAALRLLASAWRPAGPGRS